MDSCDSKSRSTNYGVQINAFHTQLSMKIH